MSVYRNTRHWALTCSVSRWWQGRTTSADAFRVLHHCAARIGTLWSRAQTVDATVVSRRRGLRLHWMLLLLLLLLLYSSLGFCYTTGHIMSFLLLCFTTSISCTVYEALLSTFAMYFDRDNCVTIVLRFIRSYWWRHRFTAVVCRIATVLCRRSRCGGQWVWGRLDSSRNALLDVDGVAFGRICFRFRCPRSSRPWHQLGIGERGFRIINRIWFSFYVVLDFLVNAETFFIRDRHDVMRCRWRHTLSTPSCCRSMHFKRDAPYDGFSVQERKEIHSLKTDIKVTGRTIAHSGIQQIDLKIIR